MEVLDSIEHYPHDWIIEAMKEAAKNNVRKWSYARAILESWKVNGYKTDVRPKEKVSSNSKKVKHEDNEERVNNFRKLYKERNNVSLISILISFFVRLKVVACSDLKS